MEERVKWMGRPWGYVEVHGTADVMALRLVEALVVVALLLRYLAHTQAINTITTSSIILRKSN